MWSSLAVPQGLSGGGHCLAWKSVTRPPARADPELEPGLLPLGAARRRLGAGPGSGLRFFSLVLSLWMCPLFLLCEALLQGTARAPDSERTLGLSGLLWAPNLLSPSHP